MALVIGVARHRLVRLGLVCLWTVACSGSGEAPITPGNGGTTSTASGSGGAPGSGGNATVGASGSSTGGMVNAATGGAPATTGGAVSGGIGGSAVGGGFGNGGMSTGGMSTSGGSPATGGRASGGTSTGGSSVGGVSNAGGAGGGVSTGGSATGGSGPGGAASSGGSSVTGGKAATGGLSAKGGTPATGGSSPTGGSSATGGASGGVYLPAFIIGADVTITLEDEYWGATYTDNGTTKSIEQLLKDHGFNFVRLDTFVNPKAAGGYAETMEQPFRDLAHTITLAKRVKQGGLGFMLDLHYSDTWTNPSAQPTPAAWSSLTLTTLETRVYEYTRDAVNQLKAAGAQPDIVQVGNEITNGMLWEVGRISNNNFANFATLLKAGIRAVREVNPAIQVMLHIEKCNNTATSQWWLDGVLAQGVQFDILGQSCYATAPNGVAGYQGTPAQWQTTFSALASRYPNLKFMIAEYSAEQRAANDTMWNLPNRRGLGTFNWDPTRAYSTHPNYPLFSTNGGWNRYVAVPSLMALYEQMANDYGLRAAPVRPERQRPGAIAGALAVPVPARAK